MEFPFQLYSHTDQQETDVDDRVHTEPGKEVVFEILPGIPWKIDKMIKKTWKTPGIFFN